MAYQKINLVFGPKIRIVPLRAKAGNVAREIVSREMKLGEIYLGVVGHYQGKLTPAKAKKILNKRVDANVISHELRVELPEMIAISEMTSRMKDVVKVSLFRNMMQGYEIRGHNAEQLKALLDDPLKQGDNLTYVSHVDGREFARRLSNLTGRKFRIQTADEYLLVKGQLPRPMEELREEKDGDWDNTKPLGNEYRYNFSHDGRFYTVTLRLNEDK